MMKTKPLLIFMLALTIYGCREKEQPNLRVNFKNIIDYRYLPKSIHGDAVCMADLGAWHGLCIPPSKDKIVGVTGPYLLGESCWAGPYLTAIEIAESTTGKAISTAEITSSSYPGLLEVGASCGGLKVETYTIYTSGRSHLSVAEITNNSAKVQSIIPRWKGVVFHPIKLKLDEGVLTAKTRNGTIVIAVGNPRGTSILLPTDTSYVASPTKPVTLNPKEKYYMASAVSYFPFGEKDDGESKRVVELLASYHKAIRANEVRWNGYLEKIIRNDLDRNYAVVPVKALQTLLTNWKTAAGGLKHQGIVPSMAVSYFYGFWAWDSWKHAVALASIEPKLAMDQVRAMFDYQNEQGMVADCIFPDSTENNWRNTKPPLAAWATWEVFSKTRDTLFLMEMRPKLEKYHNWWYAYRDKNNNGLCEWGSSDGTLIAAKWESGMDNAARFDSSVILPGKTGAWSINQESVDLNAYLYLEKIYLAKICETLRDTLAADNFRMSATKLKALISSNFYSETDGFFYDKYLDSKTLVGIAGPEGWTPLWCGIASPQQAKKMARVMMDSTRFNTYVPFPTLDASNPLFTTDGYWRGPVWIDQAYFAIAALRKEGMNKKADELTYKLFKNAGGLLDSLAIYENYNPINGKPLSAPNFSWSAAHLLMLYRELER
jgi:putative isomerase